MSLQVHVGLESSCLQFLLVSEASEAGFFRAALALPRTMQPSRLQNLNPVRLGSALKHGLVSRKLLGGSAHEDP